MTRNLTQLFPYQFYIVCEKFGRFRESILSYSQVSNVTTRNFWQKSDKYLRIRQKFIIWESW